MRITKLESKISAFLNGYHFYAGPAASSSDAQAGKTLPYRIVASCRNSATSSIVELIHHQLHAGFDHAYDLQTAPQTAKPLTDIIVSLACSTAERAVLVRLISRLGLEKNVRGVHWESVPNPHD